MYHLQHWIIDYLHPRGYKIDRPRGNNLYTFLLFKQPVDIWQEGTMVHAPENSCIVFTKWARQLYYNDSMDYRHDGIFLEGEDPTPLLKELGIPLNTMFHVTNPKAISDLVKEIAEESLLKETHSSTIIDLSIRKFFYKVSDIILHGESYSHSYYQRFQQLRNSIFYYPSRPWTAQYLCQELHISVSRFQHLYKEFFGTTPAQDVIQSRMEYAKYLLMRSDDSVANIASQCGYNNPEHFLRQFKDRVGITPMEYRKRTK